MELSDVPDVKCQDSKGNELNLEITLTEDREGDIQAIRGYSDPRSLESLREHLKRVAEGKEKPKISTLSGNVFDQVIDRINRKLQKSYGPCTALVIQDTSGVVWDWDIVIGQIREEIESKRNPYDKGIWVLNKPMTKIYRIT